MRTDGDWWEWPLTAMDAALLGQTYPGRPMITHHGLVHRAPLDEEALRQAAAHVARRCPVLRSTVQEEDGRLWRRVERFDEARARAAVERPAEPGWVDRPFQLDAQWPFRVCSRRLESGAFELIFTLHHGVTDGRGALGLFDWYLRSALVLARGEEAPACPFSEAPGPSLVKAIGRQGAAFAAALALNTVRSAGRFRQHRACLLEAPEAAPEGTGLAVVDVARGRWSALGKAARARGCTRNDLLWAAALKAADGFCTSRGRSDAPFRLVGGVDLRGFFGAGDILGNWVGTLEADFTPGEVRARGLEALVSRRLAEERQPERALVTPSLLGALVAAASPAQQRAVYRAVDEAPRPCPYSLLLSHIRPPGAWCWPDALGPVRLWCASTLPRKPGLGVTVTTVGESVTLTACWPLPLSSEDAVRGFLGALLARLDEYAAEA
ncbi:MAG: hypothetical protein AMXMBFR34_00270 [Myxococcaceae bacterium]